LAAGIIFGRLSAVLAVALFAAACGGGETERRAEVASRGAEVMSFDLERTTHVFEKRVDGGVQTVVADNPADSGEIASIRRHLRAEAAAFARGDFGDPSSVHGSEMPGLRELEVGAERLKIRYERVSDGARITYTTRDSELVEALHAWFEAQVSDHGQHAEEG
jgi:hypothetical protein